MEKIDIRALFPSKEKYEAAKNEFVAGYTEYVPGGFLSLGHHTNRPDVAEAKWAESYPKGYEDWLEYDGQVAYSDVKALCDKINEIIDRLEPTP